MISKSTFPVFLFVIGDGLRISRNLPEFPVSQEMHRFGGLPDFYGEQDEEGDEKRLHPFGNELAQLANRLYQADQCGKCGSTRAAVESDKRGMIPSLMGIFNVDIGKQNATACAQKLMDCADAGRHPGENNPPKYIGDTFPHLDETKRLFNTYLYPHMKDQSELAKLRVNLAETLVVHLRGTDIMSGGVKQGEGTYLPAPCKYVASEIDRGGFKKVLLVTNDNAHPCISYLKDISKVDVQYEKRSEKEDIMILMSATNLVLSTSSTYGLGAMLLNPEKHNYISMPVFSGRHECEAQFFESRLTEICHISVNAIIYEVPAPKKAFSTKAEYIQNDENFVGTVVHACNK